MGSADPGAWHRPRCVRRHETFAFCTRDGEHMISEMQRGQAAAGETSGLKELGPRFWILRVVPARRSTPARARAARSSACARPVGQAWKLHTILDLHRHRLLLLRRGLFDLAHRMVNVLPMDGFKLKVEELDDKRPET